MEERRLLLAVALSLLVLTAYSFLFAPAPQPQPQPTPTLAAAPANTTLPSAQPPRPEPAEAAAPAAVGRSEVAAESAVPAAGDDRERRVEVTAPDYTVAFTNRGARLVSWTLQRYRDDRGRPEEMVAAQSAAVRPLDVETGDAALDKRLREV